jgi:hypothetical protein
LDGFMMSCIQHSCWKWVGEEAAQGHSHCRKSELGNGDLI